VSDASTRLERALDVFLDFQRDGGTREALLARHPDLAEQLEALLEEEDEDDGDGDHQLDGEPRRFGEFTLLREIGRGGVGVVHEARQRTLERRVALKVLHGWVGGDALGLARFQREAQTLARLDHPGIVKVFDFGVTDGRPWMAMEFVDGESLAARLERLRVAGGHRGDSLRQVLEAIVVVAEALQVAHDAAIVHRDVKPSNVFLRADGSAVLGDFGLARDRGDATLTQAGTVVGTPHYMAPEQIVERGAVAARSDVFSLGATLYEAITLRRPFDGPTTEAVLQRILNRDPADPRWGQRRFPADLAAIVMTALEKEPARRYQNAQALAQDLRAFLELRPVRARPQSRSRRLWLWAWREPVRAALLVVALVALTLGGVLLARWNDLEAAALARAEQTYEDAVARALLARTSRHRDDALRWVEQALQLFPARDEALALAALVRTWFDGPAAALAELEQRAGTPAVTNDVAWVRVLLLRRSGRTAESQLLESSLGVPRTPTALWVVGAMALDHQPTPDQLRQSLESLSLANRLAGTKCAGR
jgi:hypothetical protein